MIKVTPQEVRSYRNKNGGSLIDAERSVRAAKTVSAIIADVEDEKLRDILFNIIALV